MYAIVRQVQKSPTTLVTTLQHSDGFGCEQLCIVAPFLTAVQGSAVVQIEAEVGTQSKGRGHVAAVKGRTVRSRCPMASASVCIKVGAARASGDRRIAVAKHCKGMLTLHVLVKEIIFFAR